MPTKEHLHVRRRRDGFILVEQPVVIAIVASLGGMLLPVVAKVRTKARDIHECLRKQSMNALPVHQLLPCPSYRS